MHATQNKFDNLAPEDRPVCWFVVMETARERGDFEAAAQAKRELARLGVSVRYQRPTREVPANV